MSHTLQMVRAVAIIGAGTMGRRIAFGCVRRGVGVRLYDTAPTAVRVGLQAVRNLLEEHRGTADIALSTSESLLEASENLSACVADTDWVIETVPENLDLKRQVLAEIGENTSADTFIATNSSSIPGSWLAESTGRPGRFINMNFGTPDHLKVEVMGHPKTSGETERAATSFLRQLGLVPIVARREIQGYPTNRIWRAIKKEALQLLDGGYSTAEDIDRGWMLDWHTPMGPCGLMDRIGLDVVRDIELVYAEASGDPSDAPPQLLHDMIAAGKLGVKSGEGFYTYPDPAFERPGWLTGESL